MGKVKDFLFKNSSTKQTIAKNTIWLFLGEIVGRVFKLGIIVFATRQLGVEGWGIFSYALAFVSLAYIFADIGINTFLTRELSSNDSDKYKYLSAAFFFKVLLLLLSLIASILIIPYFGSVPLQIPIIITIAVLNFSDSLREFFLSANRALQKMEREAYIKIVLSISVTVLGTILLITNPTPLLLSIAYAVGSIIATIVTIAMLPKEFRYMKWSFPLSYLKTIFNFAWPFIALTIFSTALVTIDSIMLGQMKSATEVGLYSAAQRIIQFAAIIPIYIGISLFPLLTKNKHDEGVLAAIFEKTFVLVLAIGLPLSMLCFLLSTSIMTTLFGTAFASGGQILAILAIVIIADFSYILLNNMVYVKNIQRKFIIASFVGLILNIVMNMSLIPTYGAVGAAISTTAAQVLIMVLNWVQLKRFFSFSIVPKLGIITIATVLMAVVVIILVFLQLHFILIAFVAVLAYITILYLLKEPSLSELLLLFR